MKQRETFFYIFCLFLLLSVAGCATFGPAPKNVSEAIGAGYATSTSAYHDLADGLRSGTLTASQGAAIVKQIDTAVASLDQARAIYAGTADIPANADQAQRIAQQADLILQAVIAALQTKGK